MSENASCRCGCERILVRACPGAADGERSDQAARGDSPATSDAVASVASAAEEMLIRGECHD